MASRHVIPLALVGNSVHKADIALSALPPLGLYVHFPWCVRKCPYCDFNSHEVRGSFPEAQYVEALIADLEQALPRIWGRRVTSVFFGGGTPSLLTEASIDRLITAIRARVPLAPDAEMTLEANPGAVEAGRFAGFAAAGINRVSLGIQSFNPGHLEALGRIHTEREARAAIDLALRHFSNVNLDLMYALPQQSLDQTHSDIATAVSFGPSHVSAYHLTLEPNTLLHREPPPLPDADLAADMQGVIEQTLQRNGFEHYETSAFAKNGARCRHNLNYWRFGDYLGIGAGAHSKISYADRVTREVRFKHPQAYIARAASGEVVQETSEVAARDLPFEFMMNALRLNGGFDTRLFQERTGLFLETIRRKLDDAQARGLIEVSAQRIVPTQRGRRFLNDLLQIFLEDGQEDLAGNASLAASSTEDHIPNGMSQP